jgi:tryptophan halogenase
MVSNSSFISRVHDGDAVWYHSLSDQLKYAYHLDNEKFVAYLKEKAVEFGVELLDRQIVDADVNGETGDITGLTDTAGMKLSYEFYVDCSGFRSFLLEQKLGSAYIPYKNSLFNDTAITGVLPNEGRINSYTFAESMNNGWCWNIPLRHENHRGYVFSSEFCSVDEAYCEMQTKNPSLHGEPRIIKFRSGRHSEFIKANVAGVGSSYSFVEPLESTGVHMIIDEIIVLMNNFVLLKNNPRLRNLINESMNDHWDYIRWFLSIHYRFNKKLDTPYWTHCRNHADISGFEELIALYKEVGLLSHQDTVLKNMLKYKVKDTIFDLYGIDHILLGQGVLPANINRDRLNNKHQWLQQVATWEKLQKYTIPISEDLPVLIRERVLV